MRSLLSYLLLFLLLGILSAQAQVSYDFNQSLNQLGPCWQVYNMEISTQNTINNGRNKKALAGTVPNGNPAYYLQSALLQFNGNGAISFQHKLSANNGRHRELQVLLLDTAERIQQVLYQYTYIDSAGGGAANPSASQNVSLPVNFNGDYYLKFQFIGVQGNSVGILDDLSIAATDVSNSALANAYGYCREDDIIRDTICPGESLRYELPYPIPQSTWEWSWQGAQVGGAIDTTLVSSAKDTLIDLEWNAQAQGDYILEATEVRPPYNSRDYKVEYRIHVLARPQTGAIYH